MAFGAGGAWADAGDCQNGCVMIVEVDGLEPDDVSQTQTPFLWALAHPRQRGGDPASAVYQQLLSGRNGFMWQAGRAPMTASTATAAASLLTAANPDQHGIVADELGEPDPSTGALTLRRMRALNDGGGGTSGKILKIGDGAGLDTLLTMAANASSDAEVWAFIGNPAVRLMLDYQLQIDAVAHKWSPTRERGSDPSLCPLPRATPAVDQESTAEEMQAFGERDCPARDGTTLQQAFGAFTDGRGKTPLLSYIHLAELGRTKQLHGDADVAKTLWHTDAALAAFVEGLSRHPDTSGGWGRTILVVTGNHGYEPTPIDRRVPDPEHVGDRMYDLSDFVQRDGLPNNGATLVPQGTIATVYAPQATAEDLTALATTIRQRGNAGCQELADEDCIDEVVPIASLAQLHTTWALNPLTAEGAPTGTGGQLIVTAKPGWAFGRTVERPVDDPLDGTEAEATNPYPGSAGGARNRAIAVLMNGPGGGLLPHTIKQVEGDWMPVKAQAQTPPNACNAGANAENPNNPDTMADDIAAPGHECQPETVDIALSIAALLELDTENVPIAPQARLLDEAFTPPLREQEEADPPQPELPQPEPPPPPAPIVISRGSVQVIAPPPPKDPFPYRGLIRRLRVRVTDALGRTFAMARRGATLSTIQVQGDFGKPFSRVTLTFYKRRGGGRRAKLSAIARFKPFVVRRGPVRLRLRIPKRFRPTHLGVSVQQVESEAGGQTIGRPGGGIAQIADARRLHHKKGARARRLRG
jgi:hypothetical protein